MEKKVERLNAESEKALRDLIDYKQELAQGELLPKVSDEDVEMGGAESQTAILGQMELLRRLKRNIKQDTHPNLGMRTR
jgi:hypothetical protein